MKHISTWLTLAMAAAVCAAAIALPSHYVGWQDRQRWFHTVASEDISQAGVSFNYALSTAERVDLASEYLAIDLESGNGTLDITLDQIPTENEISAEQALDACMEELRELSRLGVLPQVDWDAVAATASQIDESIGIDKTYCRLMDWEDPQRRLSLWVISIGLAGYRYSSVLGQKELVVSVASLELLPDLVTCMMDAETGKLYLASLMGGLYTPLTLSQMNELYDALKPEAWADYLGLSAPELTEPEPENEVYSYDSNGVMGPILLKNPVKWKITFPQEELDLTYHLVFEQHEEVLDMDFYSHKAGEGWCWFQLTYSPAWPV